MNDIYFDKLMLHCRASAAGMTQHAILARHLVRGAGGCARRLCAVAWCAGIINSGAAALVGHEVF